MRLFVLAAGKGTRLAPLTHDKPKCLVPLHTGKTFISHLLSVAEDTRYIEEVFLVTGHQSSRVDLAMEEKETTLETHTIYNPFYEVAGPIVSLWMGHEKMIDQNFVVCNGDTFYNDRPFSKIQTNDREAIRLCVDDVSPPRDDDMKVKLDRQGNLLHVGKDVPVSQTDAVSTGLLMVKGPAMRRAFTNVINEMMHERETVYTWQAWHNILNRLADDGVQIDTPAVSMTDWDEVDTPDELDQLRTRFTTAPRQPRRVPA